MATIANSSLQARILKARERWVDLGEGRRVKFLRPGETEFHKYLIPVEGDPDRRTWSIEVEHVQKLVVDWDGFTEATLLGASVGGDIVVEFSPELWATVVVDNADWSGKVGREILDSIVSYIVDREKITKN